MIQQLEKNIVTSEAQVLLCTVNCVGVMGKGLALSFRDSFPKLAGPYRSDCVHNQIHPGNLYGYLEDGKHFYPNSTTKLPKRLLILASTKNDWRNASKHEWISSILLKLVEKGNSLGFTSISMPIMGTGNGWLPRQAMLDLHLMVLAKANFDVELCTWHETASNQF